MRGMSTDSDDFLSDEEFCQIASDTRSFILNLQRSFDLKKGDRDVEFLYTLLYELMAFANEDLKQIKHMPYRQRKLKRFVFHCDMALDKIRDEHFIDKWK